MTLDGKGLSKPLLRAQPPRSATAISHCAAEEGPQNDAVKKSPFLRLATQGEGSGGNTEAGAGVKAAPVRWPLLRATLTFPDLATRSEEHTSELQSRGHLVCRLLLEA